MEFPHLLHKTPTVENGDFPILAMALRLNYFLNDSHLFCNVDIHNASAKYQE